MAMLALAVPILPGRTEQWRGWIEALRGPRYQEFVASRQRVGLRERVFLQVTPQGEQAIIVWEGADLPEALQQLLSADDEFTRWGLQQGWDVHGLDPAQPRSVPWSKLVLDSQSG
jgi:hypothetical protein